VRPAYAKAALLAAALSASGAAAQETGEAANILGSWAFEAAPTYPTCSLFGEVTIEQGATPERYDCVMVANDVCPDVWAFRAEQVCSATRKGDQLTIVSRIERIDPPTDRYLPDNFTLTIIDGALMLGDLRSAIDAPARFVRQNGPIS
jgi:hypothetical protein